MTATEFYYSKLKETYGKSKYKYVSKRTKGDVSFWRASLQKYNWAKHFKTEREAALGVDLFLINLKLEPINILKRR